jgi:cell division inhibitor SepF
MVIGDSLRRAASYLGGGQDDYDEYEGDELQFDDEPAPVRDGSHTLVLLRTPRREFFLTAPHVFDDVQDIASRLKAEVPVLVDLQHCDGALAARVVDFCSGAAYALDGGVHRVGERVLLLSTAGMDLTDGSGLVAQRQGFYNQV